LNSKRWRFESFWGFGNVTSVSLAEDNFEVRSFWDYVLRKRFLAVGLGDGAIGEK
jgi:hypothetical protein